jgi:hypothetical protein
MSIDKTFKDHMESLKVKGKEMLDKTDFIINMNKMDINIGEFNDRTNIYLDKISIVLMDELEDYTPAYEFIKTNKNRTIVKEKQLQIFRDNVAILLASDEFGDILKKTEIRYTDILINNILRLAEKMNKFNSTQIYKIASFVAGHSFINSTPFDLSQLK